MPFLTLQKEDIPVIHPKSCFGSLLQDYVDYIQWDTLKLMISQSP